MGYLASFSDFLVTGALGPLGTGLTPGETAALVGVPDAWIVGDDEGWPLYWRFGDHVEIAFDATGRMEFLQIERAGDMSGEAFHVGSADRAELSVALDGFTGQSPPSAYVRAALRRDAKVTVAANHLSRLEVRINGRVNAIFGFRFGDGSLPMPGDLHAMDPAAAARALAGAEPDPDFMIDSIYSLSRQQDATAVPEREFWLSGADYLAAAEASG